MLKPIHLDTEKLTIHPFRPEDLDSFEKLTHETLAILSDEHTLKFLPSKRLSSFQEAELFLQTTIVNYHSGRNYLHFITDKKLKKVIGMIDIISPETARDHYIIKEYPFFIEFYLGGFASGQGIMTEALPILIDVLHRQGIFKIGAIVNKENAAARKVLENADFKYSVPFDISQDLFEVNLLS